MSAIYGTRSTTSVKFVSVSLLCEKVRILQGRTFMWARILSRNTVYFICLPGRRNLKSPSQNSSSESRSSVDGPVIIASCATTACRYIASETLSLWCFPDKIDVYTFSQHTVHINCWFVCFFFTYGPCIALNPIAKQCNINSFTYHTMILNMGELFNRIYSSNNFFT